MTAIFTRRDDGVDPAGWRLLRAQPFDSERRALDAIDLVVSCLLELQGAPIGVRFATKTGNGPLIEYEV